jgi:hypothetical protein
MPITCGQCEDGWVCEEHEAADCMGVCGMWMPCTNPTCPLFWNNEIDDATGLVRPEGTDEPWRLASPVLRRKG